MIPRKKVFVAQLVYPSELSKFNCPALLIGWNTEQFQCTVAAALPLPFCTDDIGSNQEEDFYSLVSDALKLCYEDPNFLLSRHRRYPYQPIVLGKWIPSEQLYSEKSTPKLFKQSSIWITLTSGLESVNEEVKVLSLFSLGSRYETSSYLIAFDSVNTDQLKSLNVADPMVKGRRGNLTDPLAFRRKDNNFEFESQKQELSSFNKSKPSTIALGSLKEGQIFDKNENMLRDQQCTQFWRNKSEVENITIQINAAHDLKNITIYYMHMLQEIGTGNFSCVISNNNKSYAFLVKSIRFVSFPFYKLLNWTSVMQSIIQQPMPWLTQTLNSFTWQNLFPTRELTGVGTNNGTVENEYDAQCFNSRSIGSSFSKDHSRDNIDCGIDSSKVERNLKSEATNLKSTYNIESFLFQNFTVHGFSFFLCELHERSNQLHNAFAFCGLFPLVWNVDAVYKTKVYYHVQSIVAFVLVDMILGIIFGYLVYRHARQILLVITMFMSYFKHNILYAALEWFNHAPGGIKLNPFITKKIGASIVMFLEDSYSFVLWGSYSKIEIVFGKPVNYVIAEPDLEIFVHLIEYLGCMGGIGLSLELAFIADLLSLITMPITLLHILFAFIIKHHSMFIYSLWLLFSGQKKNILRKRVDTCEYNREQLLFGMMLFTIAIFVWPSFCAYYLLLALVRVCVLIVVCFPWQFVVILREFPYLPILVYCATYVQRVIMIMKNFCFCCSGTNELTRFPTQSIIGNGIEILLTRVDSRNPRVVADSTTSSETLQIDDMLLSNRELSDRSGCQNCTEVGMLEIIQNDQMMDIKDETADSGEVSLGDVGDKEASAFLRNREFISRSGTTTLFSCHESQSQHLFQIPPHLSETFSTEKGSSVGDTTSEVTLPSTSEFISIIPPYIGSSVPLSIKTSEQSNHFKFPQNILHDSEIASYGHGSPSTKTIHSNTFKNPRIFTTTSYFKLVENPRSFVSLFHKYYDWVVFLSIERRFFLQMIEQFITGKPLFLKLINLSLVFHHQKHRQLNNITEDIIAQCLQLKEVGKCMNIPTSTETNISMEDILQLCIRDNNYEETRFRVMSNNFDNGYSQEKFFVGASSRSQIGTKMPNENVVPFYNNPLQSATSLWLLFSVVAVTLLYMLVAVGGTTFFMITEIASGMKW